MVKRSNFQSLQAGIFAPAFFPHRGLSGNQLRTLPAGVFEDIPIIQNL